MILHSKRPCAAVGSLLALVFAVVGARANAQDDLAARQPAPEWNLHAQMTVVDQEHGRFEALYTGANSLAPTPESDTSTTASLFFTWRPWRGAELILVPEVAGGRGLSRVTGVAGFPNGDIVRVANPQLKLYTARACLRQVWSLGPGVESVEDDAMQLAGERPASRLTLTAGKFAAPDVFDDNAYSHDTRAQFMNWALWENAAWDYPADTRGYTWGVALELEEQAWALRVGSFLEPLEANGMALNTNVGRDHGDVVEFEVRHHLLPGRGRVKLLAYQNHADMGTYRVALAEAGAQPPDVTKTRRDGTLKYGFGLNLEQPLSDALGAFARWGWDDGRTETWAFTEVDRTSSLGILASGRIWGRAADTAGVAVVSDGLSPDHRAYLAAGGYGFLIGDGALDYGHERILEAFYNVAVTRGVVVAPDFQYVVNPAYNRARGPVSIWALRLHWEM